MAKPTITRREFLGATASVGASVAAFTIVPARVLGGPRHQAPSEKLNIAGIGVGGMGASNLHELESQNIVALCDVDHEYAAPTFKKYPDAKVYTDYRELLEKQKDIDAVVIATPDHTHAVIAMAAIQSGKHVYCQKPLTHDVYEARMLAKAGREAHVATQMGIQGHSGEGARLICEWIAAGAVGEVREVDAWCALSYYPWGHASWSPKWGGTRPEDTPAVPSTLNWDLFLGPAPERPYHPAYHPASWRAWLDFGSSMMGDRGAHTLDPLFWALKLTAPTSVEANAMGQTDETHALAAVVTYQFPARGSMPPVKLTWYEGLRAPRPEELEADRKMGDGEGGAIIKGSKGKLMCGTYGNGPRLIPESRMQEYQRPAPTLSRVSDSHELDWVRACKSASSSGVAQPAGANFDYAGPLTEACVLGNIAKRMDARIEWDAEKMQVTNLPAANELVRKTYRAGWRL